jgi:hypothetical protein
MVPLPIAVSTVGLILIIVAAVALLFLIGGLFAVRVRDRRRAAAYDEHVAQADAALQQARALDRGWDRATMEATAEAAVRDARPGFTWDDLHLVLVDDKPGIEEDRAHFVALGDDGEARVILAREGDRWVAERVE